MHRCFLVSMLLGVLYHRTVTLKRRLRTLSECGRYEDYFVVTIPGKFEREKVGMKNEKIKLFVENFRKKYRKDAK